MSSSTRLKLKTPLLPILVFIVLIVRLFDPYAGWTILLVGLGGAWLISWWWARALARALTLRREVRYGWAQVGDRLEERFTLKNQSFFPALWVELVDYSTMPGYKASCATGVGGSAQNSWQMDGVCSRRGLFRHGPASLLTSDPFGIYSVEISAPHSSSLLVMPVIIPLPDTQIPPAGWSAGGRPTREALEQMVTVSSIRPYVPGEPLRWIHWRTTAKFGELFVRMFDGDPSGDWRLILDLDQDFHDGDGQEKLLEDAISLAASLAMVGLSQGKAVGLSVNGLQPTWLAPRSGDGQRWEILRLLAMAEPGSCRLKQFLTIQPSASQRSASSILITASQSPDWLKTYQPSTASLIFLIDSESYNLPGHLQDFHHLLVQIGYRHQIISRSLFDRPESHPGTRGTHEFRVTPSGRAILVNPTSDQEWRELS